MDRPLIQRGDLVRMTVNRIDFYGSARTGQSPSRRSERIRVAWHPDFGTWEDLAGLTVISVMAMGAA